LAEIKKFKKWKKNLANPRLKKVPGIFKVFFQVFEGYYNNKVSGGTGGSGKGKSSMRDNSFGGGS